MAFVLPSIWLYWIWSQTAGGPSTTRMRGVPPPGHAAFIHAENAVVTTVSVCASVKYLDAFCCTENSTQDCGQATGVPQSSAVAGSHTAAECAPPVMQLEVRQYARATPVGRSAARQRPSE